MWKFFGLDKLFSIPNLIRINGGFKNSLRKMYVYDTLKFGCLVGCDKYGNLYYENPYYFFGRNRWVEYARHVHLDYDGSQIPADWFGWMHYKTDIPPTKDESRPNYKWMSDHSENLTGTAEQYMPYTTTRPKIHAWSPKQSGKNSREKCM